MFSLSYKSCQHINDILYLSYMFYLACHLPFSLLSIKGYIYFQV